eukprot:13687687-Ditylum_brightwellii.AAC.1
MKSSSVANPSQDKAWCWVIDSPIWTLAMKKCICQAVVFRLWGYFTPKCDHLYGSRIKIGKSLIK